ncbi:hypothetical protein F5887DRAFT_914469 [Amanita rubescens]|nr:hypothetical protein F5887DRAFT_914469 [Amanita rubescens]
MYHCMHSSLSLLICMLALNALYLNCLLTLNTLSLQYLFQLRSLKEEAEEFSLINLRNDVLFLQPDLHMEGKGKGYLQLWGNMWVPEFFIGVCHHVKGEGGVISRAYMGFELLLCVPDSVRRKCFFGMEETVKKSVAKHRPSVVLGFSCKMTEQIWVVFATF